MHMVYRQCLVCTLLIGQHCTVTPFCHTGITKQLSRKRTVLISRMLSTQEYKFETLEVTKPRDHVFQVNINRPEKRNAMNQTFWR